MKNICDVNTYHMSLVREKLQNVTENVPFV